MKPPIFIEKGTKRYVDTLYLVLIHSGRYNLLPELYEIFGPEALFKFLEIFAGTTITVPAEDVLRRAVRDVSIYLRLLEAPAEGRAQVIRNLAAEYSMTPQDVEEAYHDMQRFMLEYDVHKLLRTAPR